MPSTVTMVNWVPVFEENGTKAHVTLWSPSADQVDIIVYDKNNQDKVLAEHALSKGPRGTWQADLLATDFGLGKLNRLFLSIPH